MFAVTASNADVVSTAAAGTPSTGVIVVVVVVVFPATDAVSSSTAGAFAGFCVASCDGSRSALFFLADSESLCIAIVKFATGDSTMSLASAWILIGRILSRSEDVVRLASLAISAAIAACSASAASNRDAAAAIDCLASSARSLADSMVCSW